jgi:hypothetical protein
VVETGIHEFYSIGPYGVRLLVEVAIQCSRTFEMFLRVAKPGMGLCVRGRFASSL